MINVDVINGEIAALEEKDTNYAVCQKLAWLYVVRDHLTHSNEDSFISAVQSVEIVTPSLTGSDFLKAASGVNVQSLLAILNEHMDVIKVMYPKEYEAIMARIEALK